MSKAISLVSLTRKSDSITDKEIREWIRQRYPNYKKDKA
jgi:hypothetical protein